MPLVGPRRARALLRAGVRSPEALARAPPELVAEAVAGRGALDRPLADAIAHKVRAMRERAAPRPAGRDGARGRGRSSLGRRR